MAIIKTFRSGRRKYLFDGFSGQILELTAIEEACAKHLADGSSNLEVRRTSNFLAKLKKFGIPVDGSLAFRRIDEETAMAVEREGRLENLTLNLSGNCNQRCVYCIHGPGYQESKPFSNGKMTRETAEAALGYLINASRNTQDVIISFYGGEALLEFEIIQHVIALAKDKFPNRAIRYTLTSNLTLLTREIAEFLVANRFYLTVSLDGPAKIHDRYRVTVNGQGTHSKVMEGLRLLYSLDSNFYANNVSFNTVLAWPIALDVLEEYFLESQDPLIALPAKRFSTIAPGNQSASNAPTGQDFAAWCEVVDRRIDAFIKMAGKSQKAWKRHFVARSLEPGLRRIVNIRAGKTVDVVPLGACVPMLSRAFVSDDGDLHLCEKMVGRFPVGNVRSGIDPAKMRNLTDQFRAEMERLNCAKCWAARLCDRCYLPLGDGGLNASGCAPMKADAEDALKAFVRLARSARPASSLAEWRR